jgi:AmpE protein
MEFLVFLAAYVVRRKLDQANLFVGDLLWRKAFAGSRTVAPGREGSLVRGLLMVVVPALALGLAEMVLSNTGAGWSLAVHPFAFIVLLGLMGTPGLGGHLEEYSSAWRRGDMQSAWHRIKNLLPPKERGAASSPEYMHLALSETVIRLVFERYFTIAFWYVIAGIGGAFLATGLIALREHWPQSAARPGFGKLADWVNYLPARLLGLTFGVAGDLAGWLKDGKTAVLSLSRKNTPALMTAASSALTGYELEPERFSRLHPESWADFGDRSLAGIRGLLNRSMLVWICGLALLVIAGIV